MTAISRDRGHTGARAMRTPLAALAALLIVSAGLWTYETVAAWAWARAHPAPGLLVDLGGYRLHLLCMGAGAPTVVLEAGVGDFSLVWGDVQRGLSHSVHTCSYDRGGLGWSDSSPLPRDPSHEAAELHRLLQRANVPPPYVLVGHSYGADLVHVYATKFPAQLVGVVLVEASNEDKWPRIPGMLQMWQRLNRDCRHDEWRATFGLLRLRHQSVPPDYPSAARALTDPLTYTKKDVRARCEEYASLIGAGRAEVDSARSIGNVPLTVISAGKNIFDGAAGVPAVAAGATWKALQLESLHLSTQSIQVIASESGHYVQFDQPAVVIQQVLRLVTRAGWHEHCCVDSIQD